MTVIKPTESNMERVRLLILQASRAKKGQTIKETEPGYKQRLPTFRRNQDKD